jgi:hypothetical protein
LYKRERAAALIDGFQEGQRGGLCKVHPTRRHDIKLPQNHYLRTKSNANVLQKHPFSAIDRGVEKIVMEWLNVTHVIDCELTKIEFERELFPKKPLRSLQEDLIQLYYWRRRSLRYSSVLSDSVQICRNKFPKSELDVVGGGTRDADFDNIHCDVENLRRRTETLADVVSSIMAAEEAH